MKLTSQQIERIALWSVVLILIIIVAVAFSQHRSGFTPSTGSPISLVDLQEYAALSEKQKIDYRTELVNKTNTLTAILMNNDVTPDVKQRMYAEELSATMRSVLTSQAVPPPTAQQPPMPPMMPAQPPMMPAQPSMPVT